MGTVLVLKMQVGTQAKCKLEKARVTDQVRGGLAGREDAADLAAKGVLRAPAGGNVARALQGAQAQLESAQRRDKVKGRLERRPSHDALQNRGVKKGGAVSSALSGAAARLEQEQKGDSLNVQLGTRPDGTTFWVPLDADTAGLPEAEVWELQVVVP